MFAFRFLYSVRQARAVPDLLAPVDSISSDDLDADLALMEEIQGKVAQFAVIQSITVRARQKEHRN